MESSVNQHSVASSLSSPALSEPAPATKISAGIVGFLLTLVTILFTWPMWRHPTWWGIHDWPQFYAWYEIPRLTLLQFHQFPLWNPYLGGGNPELAHTHSPFLSPFFLPVLLFGPVVGLKLSLLLYLIIGISGMAALTRSLQCDPVPSLLSAGLWGLNGWIATRAAVGHIDCLQILLLPWVVLWFFQRRLLLTSAMIALTFFSGGPYPFLFSIGFVVLLAIAQGMVLRSRQPLQDLFVVGGYTFGFGAIKLLPSLEFLFQALPPMEFSSCNLQTLLTALLSPKWEMVTHFRDNLGSWEYNAHIGWLTLGLVLLSLLRLNSQGLVLLMPGLVSLLLAFGQRDPSGLFPLLQRLPVFHSFHTPFRLIILVIFSLAVITGIGLTRWMAHSSRRRNFFIRLAILFALGELFIVNRAKFDNIFTVLPPSEVSSGPFSQIQIGLVPEKLSPRDLVEEPFHRQMFLSFLQGLGIVDTYDPLHLPIGAKAIQDPEYHGETYLLSGKGSAIVDGWSPNRLVVTVRAEHSDHLIVNQNFHSGWRVLKGPLKRVTSVEGLIGVPVPSGHWQITLIYLPLSFCIGAGITLVTLLIAGWHWRTAARSKRFAPARSGKAPDRWAVQGSRGPSLQQSGNPSLSSA